MLCGLHVHVELPDPDDRVDIMMRMLALSAVVHRARDVLAVLAQPFDRIEGLSLAAYDELAAHRRPRAVPHARRIRGLHRGAGQCRRDGRFKLCVVGDPSSRKHPTLELRAPDSCTLVEDSIAIAALYRTLARHLTRNPWQNWDLTAVTARSWSRTSGVPNATACTARSSISRGRRDHGDRAARSRDRESGARCLRARLPCGGATLPHHRRQRHVGRHAARVFEQAQTGSAGKDGRYAPSPTGSPKQRCNSAPTRAARLKATVRVTWRARLLWRIAIMHPGGAIDRDVLCADIGQIRAVGRITDDDTAGRGLGLRDQFGQFLFARHNAIARADDLRAGFEIIHVLRHDAEPGRIADAAAAAHIAANVAQARAGLSAEISG